MKRFIVLFPVLVFAFDYLFWNQTPGINVLLFTLLVIALVFVRNRDAVKNKTSLVFAAGAICSGWMVFAHGAGWALFANIVSLLLFGVAAVYPRLRDVFANLLQAILSLLIVPGGVVVGIMRSRSKSRAGRIVVRAGLVLIPVLISIVFYLMYLWGSPHFLKANYGLIHWLDKMFSGFSPEHFWFLAWACWMGGYFLLRATVYIGDNVSSRYLTRERRSGRSASMLGLKREYFSGVVLLVLLNALIALVNYIDIRTVWFTFKIPENFSLKDFVHEGTWILIVCILMSMGIVLWLFRGNQNFYRKNRAMKILAYAWIAQNLVLAFSVFMRNYYYIAWHGLAYGRIVVIVSLIAVGAALLMMWLKISRKYTARYFLGFNSWVMYALVIGCAFVNWDRVIIEHNFRHKNISQIDFGFYMCVSGDLYPEVYAHHAEADNQVHAHLRNRVNWVRWSSAEGYWEHFSDLRNAYFRKVVFEEWQSWTLNDRESIGELRRLVQE